MDVAIEPNKPTYIAGEPVFITAIITNTGVTPFTIEVWDTDSCLSAISLAVDELHRSDRPPCVSQGDTGCAYDGPGPRSIEIKPHSAYEIRRLLNRIYDLNQPGNYRARVKVHLVYADVPPADTDHASPIIDRESDLTVDIIQGDADALKAAFAPVLADLDSDDFERHWYAQHVLLTLAPRFAEPQILAWADRLDVGRQVMPALRKLGTKVAIEKLEAIAFEEPDGNQQREYLRQAATEQIKYINDPALLPKLFAITAQNRVQMFRWYAASAAARIGHGEAVPAIGRMLRDTDPLIAFAVAEALGDTASPEAVGLLISAIPSATKGNMFPAIVDALAKLTHRTTAPDFSNRMATYQKWNRWWTAHKSNANIYGPDTCGAITPLN